MALGSPRLADDKLLDGTVMVVGKFGLKVEYVPFEQDLAQAIEEACIAGCSQ